MRVYPRLMLRQLERRLLRGERRLRLHLLRIEHAELLFGRGRLRPRLLQLRGRAVRPWSCSFSPASADEDPVLCSFCWRARSRSFCSTVASTALMAACAAWTLASWSPRCGLEGTDLGAAAAATAAVSWATVAR